VHHLMLGMVAFAALFLHRITMRLSSSNVGLRSCAYGTQHRRHTSGRSHTDIARELV
jgi:hypothetical protein